MSLKYDKIEYLLLQKDIADAVEDLKNGKKHAKRNLYKFIYFRRIDKSMYKELVKRFYKVNVRKKKKEKAIYYIGVIPLNKETLISTLYILSIIAAICVCVDAVVIVKKSYWLPLSVGYLIILAFAYHYDKSETIQSKDSEIAKLKHEIYILKEGAKCDKHIIELLEKELEEVGK